MYDLRAYRGPAQPTWAPDMTGWADRGAERPTTGAHRGIVLLDGVLDADQCADLIAQFDAQRVYPVGRDGYANTEENAGSHRAQAWAPDLASKLTPPLQQMPLTFSSLGRDLVDNYGTAPLIPHIFEDGVADYHLLGSTPWLRFMRYEGGGSHVPHYDASFVSEEERYRTIYSYVVYLNDVPEADGGAFEFVHDGLEHPQDEPIDAFDDWREMAGDKLVWLRVQPKRGRMLIFPHWLCHQVGEFTGAGRRYIVRGDLAYAIAGR